MRAKQLAARISRMSAHEIGYRLRQEVWKRADAAGLARAVEPFDEAAPHGRFFFDNAAERAALIRPEDVQATVAQAEKILRHRFDLLGYEDLDYGADIDWHLDAVCGVRAPRTPWYRIPFLDSAVAGDHKVTWELNRHQHLVALAKANLFTGDRRFLDEVVAQWRHWSRENPYPIGINWASALEVAFRSLSWIWVLHLVRVPIARDIRAALGFNARYIEKYLSLYFAPNTHLLGEAVALFFIGTLWPGFRSARRWRDLGWQTILTQIDHQVLPDGMHFEQSVYYHVYALDFFRHAQLLAARNSLKSEHLDAAIDRMSALLEGISQGGLPPRFGDDDGGRLFNPRRNRTRHLLDPITRSTEESLWLQWGGPPGPRPTPSSASLAFEHGGLYCMTGGGRQIIIDAGPHGTGNGGHGHADALSLQWIAGGREWLTDPGAFRYMGPERDTFRGTAAHNTLCVDGLDQAEAAGPFIWRGLPRTTVERWETGPEFDLFCGSHDGYRRLPQPVTHRRWVMGWKTGACLVRDLAVGEGEHTLDISWHLGPDFALHCHSESAAIFAMRDGPALAVLNAAQGWRSEVVAGDWSPAYGARVPAPVLRFRYRGRLPAECAVAFVPLPHAGANPGALTREGSVYRGPSWTVQFEPAFSFSG